jgi:hypothetical protein
MCHDVAEPRRTHEPIGQPAVNHAGRRQTPEPVGVVTRRTESDASDAATNAAGSAGSRSATRAR